MSNVYNYTILLHTEDTGFSAAILELPGCFAQGKTADEAIMALWGAAGAWIDAAQGQNIPKPCASGAHAQRTYEKGLQA